MSWNRAKIFERTANLYAYSRQALCGPKSFSHIFVPWSEECSPELMFELKAKLINKGKVLIPFMQSDGGNAIFDMAQVDAIQYQLENGIETHLYMSNLDSIHVWKVTNIIMNGKFKKKDNIHEFFQGPEYKLWIEVEDLFVMNVSHYGKDRVIAQLDELMNLPQEGIIFRPIRKVAVNANDDETIEKWVDLNRSVTYDYFMRGCELQENIYLETWGALCGPTRHYLIVAEQNRNQATALTGVQKFCTLQLSFEHYLSAVINELNEIYIRPFISAFREYDSLFEAWGEAKGSVVRQEVVETVNDLLENKKDHIDSLAEFLDYIHAAKSFLFSLRTKFEKKIGKEEYLQLENFLIRQENLVESFQAKNIATSLNGLLEIKKWFSNTQDEIDGNLDAIELRNRTLKLSYLLNMMGSSNYQDNIFFKIIEEKTARVLTRKSFEEEVKALLNKVDPFAA